MPRPLRFVPTSGGLVEVTTRAIHGRLLLRPTPATNQAILGVLGRAQKMYDMVVHSVVFLSNHYHLLLAPTDADQLSGFMTFVNSNIAREVGRLVSWKEKFWGRRYHSMVVSDEKEAQLGRLAYHLSNCVKEGLVEHPFEWPGVHSARALLEDRKLQGTWFDRTAYRRALRRRKPDQPMVKENDFKSVEVLELTPLPCLAGENEVKQREQILSLIAQIVADAAAERKVRGTMVLGAHRVQQQHPHTQPKELKKSPAPLFHAHTKKVKKALRDAYFAFAAAFKVASERLRGGDRAAVFPEGCFPPALPFCA